MVFSFRSLAKENIRNMAVPIHIAKVNTSMVFNQGEGLPEHLSNSNVYMTVIRGRLSIGLDDQEIHEYEAGTLLKIPFQTKMNVKNVHDETLELIVVKAPAPKS